MRCRLLVFNQQVQLNLFNGNRGRYSADEMVTLAAELTASSPVTVQWTSYESSGKWQLPQPLSGHLTQSVATFLLFYFLFFELSHGWQVVYCAVTYQMPSGRHFLLLSELLAICSFVCLFIVGTVCYHLSLLFVNHFCGFVPLTEFKWIRFVFCTC